MKRIYLIMLVLLMFSCKSNNMNDIFNKVAEDYVKLVLEVGQYDPYFVDAYYGPEEWKPEKPEDDNSTVPSKVLLQKSMNLIENYKKLMWISWMRT